ncbi:MAG: selenocysteine-specific translation elongation factor [Chloroflexi bacterium]|nr:selenocysteine-specific translation elongation factor [Chloroflexota bacterium]
MRVIGTAGHVDHGKSTLIRALTGIDPDRLQEEKERGMTIDLGFAWLRLPNGVEVSIVDVPGHERFIHNMLAGVGGIDIALLVVAADEGVMPQTREHVAILDLLGIANGVVALTKRDLVDEEWLELVQADVEDFLKTTTLRGVPLVPCSATTGVGLEALRRVIQDLLARERMRPNTGRPRLPIDRVFTVAGFGTVVTGTLIDGELHLGQELEVQPGGLKARVRGLQSHRKKLETIPAGTRTAVNLGGLAVEDLGRGQLLCAPGTLTETRAVDARLRLIREARPLRHNTEITFHTGAAETLGKLLLLDRDELQPGEEAWVQVRLQDPVALARGDLFVLRLPSPSMTVGGGSVVEPHARRHRRRQPAVLQQLEVLAQGTPEEIVLERLRAREPSDVESLVQRTGLAAAEARQALRNLLQTSDVVLLDHTNGPSTAVVMRTAPENGPEKQSSSMSGTRDGGARFDGRSFVVSAAGWQRITDQVEVLLQRFHTGYPLRRGLPKEELRTRLGAEPRLFVRALERLKTQGTATEDGPFVRLATHSVQFSPEQERQADQILRVLREAGVSPPDRAEIEAELRLSPELVDALLAQGQLIEVTAGLLYEPETLDELVALIRADIQQQGPRTVAQIRDLLHASRKFALALVNYTDEHKITRRVGDQRILY